MKIEIADADFKALREALEAEGEMVAEAKRTGEATFEPRYVVERQGPTWDPEGTPRYRASHTITRVLANLLQSALKAAS